jgi:hypothetical protein
MNLIRRIASLEELTARLHNTTADVWFSDLLADFEANEPSINAAYLLALNDVIEKPSAGIWQRLEAYYGRDAEEMSDTQLSFIAAYNELDSEVFDDDDGKNLLCVFAVIYYRVFEDAPKPPQRYGQHKRDGIRAFIVPLLNRACSGIKGYSHATHDAWVEKAHKEMQEDEEAKLLESLYSYVRSLPFSKDWTP